MAWMETVAIAASLAEALAVVVAVVFGVTQLRASRRDARERSTVEVVRALQAPGFAQAHQRVMDLEPGLGRSELAKAGALDAATSVMYFYESLGVLARRGVAELDIVLDLYHVDDAWARLSRFAEEQRAAQRNSHLFEWFQWLAIQDAEHSARAGPAAYEAHAHG